MRDKKSPARSGRLRQGKFQYGKRSLAGYMTTSIGTVALNVAGVTAAPRHRATGRTGCTALLGPQHDLPDRPAGDALDAGGVSRTDKKKAAPRRRLSLGRKRPRKQTAQLASQCCDAQRKETRICAQVRILQHNIDCDWTGRLLASSSAPRAEFREKRPRPAIKSGVFLFGHEFLLGVVIPELGSSELSELAPAASRKSGGGPFSCWLHVSKRRHYHVCFICMTVTDLSPSV